MTVMSPTGTRTTGDETADLSGLRPVDLVDAWRDANARMYVPWDARPSVAGDERFRARLSRWYLGDLALVDASCGRARGRRGRREIAATADVIGIAIMRRGHMKASFDGDTITVSAGQAMVWDGRRSEDFDVPSGVVKRTLIIPRDRLRAALPAYERMVGRVLSADDPPARLLARYLDTLASVLPDLDVHGRLSAADAALELAAGALAGCTSVPRAARETLRAAIRRHIGEHLADPGLTPTGIAQAHAISLRTLHGLFEGGESVSALIRRERLERCYADLVAPTEDTVLTVALRWGFRDPSHFARLFRARFGVTPREARADARY
jgi:AraC family transcriptional regulator, positive regulator of tynA and feaB